MPDLTREERSKWRRSLGDLASHLQPTVLEQALGSMLDQVDRLEADYARLLAAFYRYGRHKWQCQSRWEWSRNKSCDCGYAAALTAAAGEK